MPRWLLLCAAALLPLSARATDWPQFGFDAAHSGHNPAETQLGRANVARLASRWGAITLPAIPDGAPAYAAGIATPSGMKDLLFAFGTTSRQDGTQASGMLLAIDAADGSVAWSSAPTSGMQHASSSPAIDPSRLYVYAYGLDGCVHKYAIGTGSEVTGNGWPERITLKPQVEKVAGGLTIAATGGGTWLEAVTNGYDGDGGDYQGHLVAIDLGSGAQVVFNAMCSNLGNIHFVANGTPEVDDCNRTQSAGYGPGQQGGIWGRGGATFDESTGRLYVTTGNGDYTASALGYDWGDTVLALGPDGSGSGVGLPLDSYTPDNEGYLYSNDLDLGSVSLALLPAPAGSTVAHLGVQAGKDGVLRLLDLDDLSGAGAPAHVGGELQQLPVPQGNSGYMKEQPAVWTNPADGAVWLFAANSLGLSGLRLCLDDSCSAASGTPRLVPQWSITNAYSRSPVIANGVLYASAGECQGDSCHLVARDPLTGGVLWTSPQLGALHWQSPIVVDGAVYLIDDNARAWKFSANVTDVIFEDGFDG